MIANVTPLATQDVSDKGRQDGENAPREDTLWEAWQKSGSVAARADLFALYQPLARRIALRQFRNCNGGDIDLADVLQLAHSGLLEAIDRFNPLLGVPFKYYGNRRVAGCIIDGLSSMTELHAQSSARRGLQKERLRSLKADRGATALDIDSALAQLSAIAGELALGFMLQDSGFLPGPDTEPQETPYDSLAWRQMERRLTAELELLPSSEKRVLSYHYLGGVNFARIAVLLELSTGRIAQLHKSALGTLRKRLLKAGMAPLEK